MKMKSVTGLMIYYYFVCQRKLWYFVNEINMEQNSELVEIGKILDETTYKREQKGILIDNQICIDFINEGAILHEVKKTKAIEEAGEWQIKYYMFYLERRGIKNIEGQIDYPLLKQTKDIFLVQEDRDILEQAENQILEIMNQDKPPAKLESKICKKCAYFDLCYVS